MALRTVKVMAPVLVAAAAATFSSSACFVGGAGSGTQCQTNRQFFEREVWAKFMAKNCGNCHTPGGVAVDQGAKFVLANSSFPGFIDTNLAAIQEIGKISYEGKSEILQKPLGKMNHGGGQVLAAGSPEYKALEDLVTRLAQGNDTKCDAGNTTLANVELLSASDTLRKAAIDLAGRLPTQAETAAVAQGGDAALDAALDGLMKEDIFFDRVREMYNDLMLTDRGMQFNGAAINFLDGSLYPGLAPFKDQQNPAYQDPRKPLINKAIAREPLDLIAYVVKQNRPFSEVVTAKYAVVNPYSALAYGVTPGFMDATNYNEFKEVQLTYQGSKPGAVQHAGVLTTPAFLNRWQTTPTNRNRARARRVFQFFLATDILKIADRPVDGSKLTAIQNPTMNSEYCTVCHKTMDPVAQTFRGWDEQNYESFDPGGNSTKYTDMEAPGFAGEKMDPSFYAAGLQWLGPKVAGDSRFALSAVYIVYQGLTGRKPLYYPSDTSMANYAAALQGWETQDEFFVQTADAFRKSNYDFKALVKMIVKSPYYRGVRWKGDASVDPAVLELQLADIGIGEVLTPESLNRKVTAVLGVHWRKNYDWQNQHDWLLEDFPILYGGIDSDSVIERTREPNSIMAGVAQRMANEMACAVTAWDFTKPKDQRWYFAGVEQDTAPMAMGAPVPANVGAIKANIKALHQRILGETLADGDPELERTYQVFLGTWQELQKAGSANIPGSCQGTRDPITGTSVPQMQQVTQDKNFTIRSWAAVMTYLLGDWKFIEH